MNYVYKCPAGRTIELEHRIYYSTAVICAECGERMYRVPQPFLVNWNGLRPSQGELTGEVKEYLRDADRRRAEFEVKHEMHERDTDGN